MPNCCAICKPHKVQLSALQGKVVFINIWATWCPSWVEEMPTMQRLYDQLYARGLESPRHQLGGVPKSFIVDKGGLLVEKVVGLRNWSHPQVMAIFERLLAGPDADSQPIG